MLTKRKVGVLAAVAVAAVVAALLSIPGAPARADLFNDRQKWLRESTAGLFLHWGERTSPAQTNCTTWQNMVNNAGWDAGYWVQEAKKLHAGYIVLAAFHSRLGYARAWPSKIPGTCSTKRDYLGELLTAAHNGGLHLILYMTDDPSHHAENGFEYFNSSAFSAYAGHSVDLSTRNGFGEFSYDNFLEVMDNYPTLDGFWIDNLNAYWGAHNLWDQVRAKRPNMLLSNNNEDTPAFDTVDHEQKTGMTPSYDMPQAIWTSPPRLTEADYKLPGSGAWWYDGSNSTVDRKLNIGRFVANAGSSIKSLMDEQAMQGGHFPSNQVDFNNFFNGYISQIWESIGGCEGGGYGFGGLKPGSFGNGAYGVTTINRDNRTLNYVHVLDRPTSGSSITLRDNGLQVTGVTDLRTHAALTFTQARGAITISGITNWDPYDTVLKVVTGADRVNVYPKGSVTATASASASGHPASALVDGNDATYWDNNTTVPASVTLDLGSAKKVAYLGVNQTEWSVAYNRSSGEQPARIRDYSVAVSTDGSSFSTVKSGTLPDARGVAMIDLNVASARFVRLTISSTWAASSDSKHYKKERINDIYVASDYAGGAAPPPPPPPNHYEAEEATLSQATVATNHTGFTGTGFVDYANVAGSYVQWTVNAATAGSATLTIRFANGSTAARSMDIVVGGGPPRSVSFPVTGSWNTWQTLTVPATLVAGNNPVRATATGAAGGPNVDWLEVS
jgi:alpha-L-fucosidase